MEEDKQERLRKLTELRDSGVLSEGEYQIAKTRLLAAREARATDARPEEPSLLSSYWPALVGFGILMLLVVAVVLYGKMQADEDVVDLNVSLSSGVGSNVLDAAPSGTELCESGIAHGQIKDMIFERAQQQYGGDPGPLDSLRKAVGVRMQYPMLRAVRQDVGRTDCGGHLVLDLPPSVHAAFDGRPALEADVEYAIQPAADGSGNVAQITGADQIIEQLAVAASLVGGQGKAPAGGARPQGPFNPSFDCRGTLSNVERMICDDEQLAQLDRALAERYLALRRELPRPEWQLVSESQREFLRRRARCTNVACLNDAYSAQSSFLERFGEVEDE